ncbi:hypothetical protein, partial [Shewanella algae]|uniref:hypothetical protein n=2 Tax=Gammaproteobacteria TaxID=1236 RepID=UPI00313C93BF
VFLISGKKSKTNSEKCRHSRMLITHTEIYRYSIPMVPFTIATGTMHFAQNMFIRIHTSEGIQGVGECSAFPMIVGE